MRKSNLGLSNIILGSCVIILVAVALAGIETRTATLPVTAAVLGVVAAAQFSKLRRQWGVVLTYLVLTCLACIMSFVDVTGFIRTGIVIGYLGFLLVIAVLLFQTRLSS